MDPARRLLALRIVLAVAGVACLSLWPLMRLWPSGWAWHHGHSDYPAMLIGLYATLGGFLLCAVRDPMSHRSVIWFAVVSSVVHGLIMTVQALQQPEQTGHLVGDVPALFIVALALGVLAPRRRDAPPGMPG